MEILMEWKRYRTLVALDCVLCFFYILYGIVFLINMDSNWWMMFFVLICLDFILLLLLIGADSTKLINVSKITQFIWKIMKLVIFILLCFNLRFINLVLYIISFVVTILYILLQVYFYKHNKLYFKKK